MSRGVYPQDQPCAFCHRYVNEIEATWYEGRPYHESHFKMYLANLISELEKKRRLGTITLAQAAEMADLQIMYEIERKSPATPKISRLIYLDVPVFKGNTKLALTHPPKKNLQLNPAQEHLQISGESQYNYNNTSDGLKLIENKGMFPLENPENFETPPEPQKQPFLGV